MVSEQYGSSTAPMGAPPSSHHRTELLEQGLGDWHFSFSEQTIAAVNSEFQKMQQTLIDQITLSMDQAFQRFEDRIARALEQQDISMNISNDDQLKSQEEGRSSISSLRDTETYHHLGLGTTKRFDGTSSGVGSKGLVDVQEEGEVLGQPGSTITLANPAPPHMFHLTESPPSMPAQQVFEVSPERNSFLINKVFNTTLTTVGNTPHQLTRFDKIMVYKFHENEFGKFSGISCNNFKNILHTTEQGILYPSVGVVSWKGQTNEFVAWALATSLIIPKDAFGNNVTVSNERTNVPSFSLSVSCMNGALASLLNVTSKGWNEYGYVQIEFILETAGSLFLNVEEANQTLIRYPLMFKVIPRVLDVPSCVPQWKATTYFFQLFPTTETYIHQRDKYGNLDSGLYSFDSEVIEKGTNLSMQVADLHFSEVALGIQLCSFSLVPASGLVKLCFIDDEFPVEDKIACMMKLWGLVYISNNIRDGTKFFLAQSKKFSQLTTDNAQWKDRQLLRSGVAGTEVQTQLDCKEERKVILLVHGSSSGQGGGNVKWVDEVITDAPYAITKDFMKNLSDDYNIDDIIHGYDPCIFLDGSDVYAFAKKAGRYKQIKRTKGVSSTDIVGRMLLCLRERSSCDIYKYSSLQRQFSRGHSDDSASSHGTRIFHFLPTSHITAHFSNGKGPGPDARILYIDGAVDFFHAGPMEILRLDWGLGDLYWLEFTLIKLLVLTQELTNLSKFGITFDLEDKVVLWERGIAMN